MTSSRVAVETGTDAIHPGYGFLSESPEFAEACAAEGIAFIGPRSDTLRRLGDKVSARAIAAASGVPVVPATDALPADPTAALESVRAIGFPGILKASWGGGGRGMRVVESPDALEAALLAARREAAAAFGKDDIYFERFIGRARHLEVQVLADAHGRIVHLFERDCSVQRRNQKIVECAPAPGLGEVEREELTGYALAIAREADYLNAGTVEFLHDLDTGRFHFIEVNPRIQVEHTVTEQVTGVDLVRAQIRIAEGAPIGEEPDAACPPQDALFLRGHAVQCRITTEDPLDRFIPDYGRITAYRAATGFGVRLDGGTAYAGAVITRHYDSLLEKVTVWAPSPDGGDRPHAPRAPGVPDPGSGDQHRLPRAPRSRRGVPRRPGHHSLHRRQPHASFLSASARPGEPAAPLHRRDHRQRPPGGGGGTAHAPPPRADPAPAPPAIGGRPDGRRQGPAGRRRPGSGRGVDEGREAGPRDGHDDARRHQSLLATRMRTHDIRRVADAYAHHLPDLFSLRMLGRGDLRRGDALPRRVSLGAAPELRARIPTSCSRCWSAASNAVGYTNYPDNVVLSFIAQAAASGIDVFRIFESAQRGREHAVSIDAVRETGKLCEAAICYTADLHDPERARYDLDYYLEMARELRDAGHPHPGSRTWEGFSSPRGARAGDRLREETGLPVHFHTHDTSGIAAASVLAAVDAGVDAIDLAMDSLSGFTSSPVSVRSSRRCGASPGHRARPGAHPGVLGLLGGGLARSTRRSRPTCGLPPRRSTCTRCPAGQFTNLREQAAPSVSPSAGTRWRAPTPR